MYDKKDSRKEEIILTALELASQKGLGNVSMSMIADKIGIRKPSLYHHFASKEELVEAMYAFLRERAKQLTNTGMVDYRVLFSGKTAPEILQEVVSGYIRMNRQEDIRAFYKVIYSERCHHPAAAKIMAEETERMILATKQLFYAMQVHGLLHFRDADMSAVSFALTVHGLMEFAEDRNTSGDGTANEAADRMHEYLAWFCRENTEKE